MSTKAPLDSPKEDCRPSIWKPLVIIVILDIIFQITVRMNSFHPDVVEEWKRWLPIVGGLAIGAYQYHVYTSNLHCSRSTQMSVISSTLGTILISVLFGELLTHKQWLGVAFAIPAVYFLGAK